MGRSDGPASATLRRLIRRVGPIPFARFMEVALYDDGGGFFARGGGAGRAGRDFVTSPEVGSLFGVCVARALDGWWEADGRPDPFVVVEAGAGDGRLAREVLRAEPRCAPALRYVLVERSARLRAEAARRLPLEPPSAFGPFVTTPDDELHPVAGRGPIVVALDALPLRGAAVVLANELLDNLAIDLAERQPTGWTEVRIGLDGDDLVEVPVPLPSAPLAFEHRTDRGLRVPVPVGMGQWLAEASRTCGRGGRIVAIDYVASADEIAGRSPAWLRTYRGHERGVDPLEAPGSCDITADVVHEQLVATARTLGLVVTRNVSQAQWLGELGVDELVEEGRRIWSEGAARGDLGAIAGRSRAVEAAALSDPAGLGGFTVLVLGHGAADR